MTVTEVTLCEKFDEDCEAAEAVRDRAVEEAKEERDQITSSISRGRMKPSERLLAALEARCAGRVKAAEDDFESACQRAEKDLMKALDQRKKARAQFI